jgi:hypothetical protein
MKLLIMHFSPALYYFIPLGPKYSLLSDTLSMCSSLYTPQLNTQLLYCLLHYFTNESPMNFGSPSYCDCLTNALVQSQIQSYFTTGDLLPISSSWRQAS